MNYQIALISGDGIGPEVVGQALKVFEKIKPQLKNSITFVPFDLGAAHYLKTREALPDSVFAEIAKCDAIFLGAVGHPDVKPGILEREILLRLRFELDLYINLRPCELWEGVFTPLKNKSPQDIAFTVIRENTESVYAGLGGVFKAGTPDEVAIQEDVNTRKGVERAIRYAFEVCKKRNRKKRVTLVDKANVLTHAHGLWRRVFEQVGSEYPDIARNAMYVDACAMDFVRRPEIFDVIVTNNIFGDIITDLGAVISGGLGLAASANLNPSRRLGSGCTALFEPIHGSAPDIAGKNLANPTAAILALALLLEHLGEAAAAEKIVSGVRKALLTEGFFKKDSVDLNLSTAEAAQRVLNNLS